ncbi:MAG: Ni/Fe hydrogenase subunit alpha [Candidatus Woesearchaeota archaeon]
MKELKIDHITKVEGHGKLYVNIDKGEVECVQMEIFEGARYFESLVKGRHYSEVPDITSRICGICSQSHLLCALYAIEDAMKLRISPQSQQLRELMMLASLIQSHVLHLYFLALPEYLGYDNALQMATKHKKAVERALRLKRFANQVVITIGGREIHSITPTIGGFSKLPSQEDLKELLAGFKEHKTDFEETAKLFAKLKYPKFERKTQYLALRDTKLNYLKGKLVSDGFSTTVKNYHKHIKEQVVNYSNTKCVTLKEKDFMVGALARINLNKTLLSRNAKRMINQSKIKFPSNNPFHNNAAQGFELIDFYDRSVSLLNQLKLKDEKPKEKFKAGTGFAAIEAPRGLLFHEYEIDNKGLIKNANIIAPTTQNLKSIEQDIKELLPQVMKKTKSEKKILDEAEKLVRAYDPCISCSTHFLELIS